MSKNASVQFCDPVVPAAPDYSVSSRYIAQVVSILLAAEHAMLKSVFLFLLYCGPIMAQDFSTQPNPQGSRWKKVWMVSLAALAAGNALDASTSYGKLEANPVLARNGRFGAGSIGLKIGLQAPFIGYQVWQVRRDKGVSARRWAIANFALAGAFSAVAIHNAGVPRPATPPIAAP